MQVLLHPLILPFRKAVCLGVKCGGDILLGPYVGCEHSTEVRGELRVPVCDDLLQEAKPGVDVLQIEHGDAWTGNGGGTWQEDGCLGASMVNYGKNGILIVYFGEACDQVHRYLLEWMSIYQGANLVEGDLGVVDKDFILLAGCAPFYILSNPMVHSWPREAVFGLPDCLVSPRVSCCGMVMY
jgi:hypothetical protein